jgi:3-phenylpropionate/trans-cinnamate dioxygenase ferredoxin reductase component
VPDRQVRFALIGGGVAAANCARMLRRAGADGEIVLIGREPDLPYNRPPCSKGYLQGKQSRQDTLLEPAEYYAEHDIEALTRVSAMKLDPAAKTVKLSNKQELGFDTALIATGAGVRRLNVEGSELEGIHYLRTLGNADAIRADAAGKRVVLIGGSYIASELAATLTELGSQCTMIMLEHLPLSRHFGDQAGRFFHDRLAEHGVTIHPEQELARFAGTDGRVTTVITASGLELEADTVVLGTGAQPDVMLARGAGLELGETGGVKVDATLRTSAPDIYAAGDMAEYDSVLHGRGVRIEHWDVAFQQGRAAARAMLGSDEPYAVVPYFFSDLADWTGLEYAGLGGAWDREVVRGSLEDGAFSIWYLRDGRLAGTLAVGRSEDLQVARRWVGEARELGDLTGALADSSSDLSAL